MNIGDKIKNCLGLFTLLMPLFSQADVLVNVSATMVTPACNIRSENSSAPLNINFDLVNVDELGSEKASETFSLYLSDCDFNRNLAILLSPKGLGALSYNGKKVAATSLYGLGIDFNDITGGGERSLNVEQTQRITPEQVTVSEARIDLQARLVNAVPINQLESGRFTSTVTISVTYD